MLNLRWSYAKINSVLFNVIIIYLPQVVENLLLQMIIELR